MNTALPNLTKLHYGTPYCEECRDKLAPGMLVAWWRVRANRGGTRKAVYCASCHRDRLRVYERPKRR
jgi:RNase P subunit RPR2